MVPTGRDVNSFPAPWNQIESIIRKDIKCAQDGKSENIKEKEKDKIKYANLTWSLSLSRKRSGTINESWGRKH